MPTLGSISKFGAVYVPDRLEDALQFMMDNESRIHLEFLKKLSRDHHLHGLSLNKDALMASLKAMAAEKGIFYRPGEQAPLPLPATLAPEMPAGTALG